MRYALLLIICLFVTLTVASYNDQEFFAKPGTLKSNKAQYLLQCEDMSYEYCYYKLNLPDGVYVYISQNFTDTATIVVKNDSLYELGEQKDKKFLPIRY